MRCIFRYKSSVSGIPGTYTSSSEESYRPRNRTCIVFSVSAAKFRRQTLDITQTVEVSKLFWYSLQPNNRENVSNGSCSMSLRSVHGGNFFFRSDVCKFQFVLGVT
jgi:hypothetical protein